MNPTREDMRRSLTGFSAGNTGDFDGYVYLFGVEDGGTFRFRTVM